MKAMKNSNTILNILIFPLCYKDCIVHIMYMSNNNRGFHTNFDTEKEIAIKNVLESYIKALHYQEGESESPCLRPFIKVNSSMEESFTKSDP